ncbi:twin-arginine translocase subunit TatC [Rhodohalobacter sp. SW132]|nr:twin-arginine translocase subunit TatC [Rhodohalobacter sp. SW132]
MGALLPKAKAPKIDPTASMSFLDHLEELRWRIIKGLIGVAAGIVIAFIFADFFIQEFILGPARADFFMYQIMPLNAVDLSLISRRLPGQFFTYWGTLIIIGGIIGSPVLFYQLWAFIEPALGSGKKLKTILNALFINFFFLLGISFGYFILVPFAVQFFTQFIISDVISNEFDINEYFTSVALWTLSCGILFQIPVVSYFLSKVGLVTPEGMRAYRRHAIVGALVLSAVLTPPDPVSQLMIAFPLVLLYQFSIVLSRFAHYRRKKELDAALGSGLGD